VQVKRHSYFPPTIPAAARIGADQPRGEADFGKVKKKLAPGANGTKQWLERYGSELVCVRYRENAASGMQYKTVEVLVGERPIAARRTDQAQVLVRIGWAETKLRAAAMSAGAVLDDSTKLWRMPRGAATNLGLAERIVKK
jgi:hypothetical protein